MEMARIVLGLEQQDVAEEVMHFLDRTGRARVVATASDDRQLAEAVRQMGPDAVVASTSLVPERLDGHPLLAVETAESVRSLRTAIRVGASGYFVWPVEREALAAAAGRVRTPVEPSAGAPVVAVVGARGGVGATVVATHLAAALARRSVECALVDLDVAFADVTGAVGVPTEDTVATVADLLPVGDELSSSQVKELLWHHPEGFGVLRSPGRADALAAATAAEFRHAIEALGAAVPFVLLHLPRGLGELSRTALEMADRVVVVLQLDVASFREARRMIEATGLEGRAEFVVNRAGRAEISPSDVERVFGRPPLAVIPRDRAVPAAQDRGRLLSHRGRTGRAIDGLARHLLEEAS